jgi:2-isopropylmalate synthase
MHHKYRPYQKIPISNRSWPDRTITHAPRWCSVDLRDGNQALPHPYTYEEKSRLFAILVSMGFKEIEVGYPAASETEFRFIQDLVKQNKIPPGVTIQVLTQTRKDLIQKTFAAVRGSQNHIVHLYNSTSTNQRELVFGKSPEEIIALAVEGVRHVQNYSRETNTPVRLEYSPESFTGTEPAFALRICNEVIKAWNPTPENKMIINLPATVELSSPNVYADYIEWMSKNLDQRDRLILSIHPHNDRGSAIAATELGLLAGADRVEGTLFGNGERTGNTDIVTLALNLASQGIDPQLMIGNIDELVMQVEQINKIPVHPRHPYAGQLVYTAFSGSHQDAIRKGLQKTNKEFWDVPYLPIDPADVGRSYAEVIQITSQSGKGGVTYVLEQAGINVPVNQQKALAGKVKEIADTLGRTLTMDEIKKLYEAGNF